MMLDNGYSLARVEVLNWGNFHGYQKFDLRDSRHDGLLFAPPSASAILGVNGSGKSTLIDALMITLLPFENSLKLGVTNDVESGSAGGRSVRDYVLGKHSSTNGIAGSQLAGSFGRKDGCSILILVFTHNRIPEKSVSIGRIWWFQNYTVSDTQIAFLGYEPLSIPALCPDGQTPRHPKAFRQHCKQNMPQLQLFETMQSYFTALSGSLGQISRDDLKILNRAFYVKSISQIDQFIRENMLLEQDNPHLERLLENVRNGREIAFAIETCEAKIKSIERILRDLVKLKDLSDRKATIDRQERILSLHKDWIDLKRCREELERLKAEIVASEERLPLVARAVEDARRQHTSLQSQIVHNDLDARLQKMDLEIDYLGKEIQRLDGLLESTSVKAKTLGIKLPGRHGDWKAYRESLAARIQDTDTELEQRNIEIEEKRQEKFAIEAESKRLKEELQHLSEFKTLIPKDLYSIKEDAAKALKIPASKIFFVGELIQVRKEFLQYRRAIESVLFPISRNLLCHPDHLQAFTQWLDTRGLRADVTAKRISMEELEPSGTSRSSRSSRRDELGAGSNRDSGRGTGRDSDLDMVLDMIEILPENSHPFTSYLWNWLYNTFDYQVVDVKKFRASEGKLVTVEGLVKTDNRTMRKLKQNFAFSLGWDNQDIIAEVTNKLLEMNNRYGVITQAIESIAQATRKLDDSKRFFEDLQERSKEFEELGRIGESLKDLTSSREALYRENPDYRELKEQERILARKIKDLQKQESSLESEIEAKRKRVRAIETLLPDQERDLRNSIVYGRLCQELGGESDLIEALENLQADLERKKITRLQLEARLKQEISGLDSMLERSRSAVTANLVGYRRDFDDPNLPYELPPSPTVDAFIGEWAGAEARFRKTELPQAQEKWKRFFDQILMDSVKDTINEIKSKIHEVEKSIQSINEVLKLTNFEDLPTDKRYLRIQVHSSTDERIRRFRKSISEIEKILGPGVRSQIETQSQNIMGVLVPFVEEFQKEVSYRNFVTDVRNHFQFEVHSIRRRGQDQGQHQGQHRDQHQGQGQGQGEDELVEIFSGSKKDAKSSAQTTQLAYTLLASCLAYRFKFHDPVGGQETPRILILDEFGGKFDNEKPKEILKLLDKMGFQSILVSPMSKADLLAEGISHLVLVHKVSATQSKVQSYQLASKQDYDRLVRQAAGATA